MAEASIQIGIDYNSLKVIIVVNGLRIIDLDAQNAWDAAILLRSASKRVKAIERGELDGE